MKRISVKDLDSGVMIPVGDPDNWKFQRMLFSSAEVVNGFVIHRIAIHELIEAGIWRAEWSTLPEVIRWQEENEDAPAIAEKGDQTL